MERDFLPYELAVSLKELGFDEPCSGHYSNGELIHSSHTNNQMQRFRYSAPTFSQAFTYDGAQRACLERLCDEVENRAKEGGPKIAF